MLDARLRWMGGTHGPLSDAGPLGGEPRQPPWGVSGQLREAPLSQFVRVCHGSTSWGAAGNDHGIDFAPTTPNCHLGTPW